MTASNAEKWCGGVWGNQPPRGQTFLPYVILERETGIGYDAPLSIGEPPLLADIVIGTRDGVPGCRDLKEVNGSVSIIMSADVDPATGQTGPYREESPTACWVGHRYQRDAIRPVLSFAALEGVRQLAREFDIRFAYVEDQVHAPSPDIFGCAVVQEGSQHLTLHFDNDHEHEILVPNRHIIMGGLRAALAEAEDRHRLH